ncbi:hypothetical protein LXL04_019887 [Taraxacum kok-saghyz]
MVDGLPDGGWLKMVEVMAADIWLGLGFRSTDLASSPSSRNRRTLTIEQSTLPFFPTPLLELQRCNHPAPAADAATGPPTGNQIITTCVYIEQQLFYLSLDQPISLLLFKNNHRQTRFYHHIEILMLSELPHDAQVVHIQFLPVPQVQGKQQDRIPEALMETFKANEVERNQLIEMKKDIQEDHEKKKTELEAMQIDINNQREKFEEMIQECREQQAPEGRTSTIKSGCYNSPPLELGFVLEVTVTVRFSYYA